MLKKDEKIVKEKLILKKEKKTIKTATKAITSAEKSITDKKPLKKKAPKPKKPEPKTLKSMPCFYIKYKEHDADGNEVVLEVAQKDKYHPKKTGVYNIDL